MLCMRVFQYSDRDIGKIVVKNFEKFIKIFCKLKFLLYLCIRVE